MARFDKIAVLNKIGSTGMVPVFYHKTVSFKHLTLPASGLVWNLGGGGRIKKKKTQDRCSEIESKNKEKEEGRQRRRRAGGRYEE